MRSDCGILTDPPHTGYTKIRDALRGVGVEIGRTTIADILKDAGLEPAPEREKKRAWRQFIRSHMDSLYACDFFSVESLSAFGTVRFMVFFVMEVRTRTVEIAGIRIDPDEAWMLQVARNLTGFDGFLAHTRSGYILACEISILHISVHFGHIHFTITVPYNDYRFLHHWFRSNQFKTVTGLHLHLLYALFGREIF